MRVYLVQSQLTWPLYGPAKPAAVCNEHVYMHQHSLTPIHHMLTNGHWSLIGICTYLHSSVRSLFKAVWNPALECHLDTFPFPETHKFCWKFGHLNIQKCNSDKTKLTEICTICRKPHVLCLWKYSWRLHHKAAGNITSTHSVVSSKWRNTVI